MIKILLTLYIALSPAIESDEANEQAIVMP
jgi:hypothetical protein